MLSSISRSYFQWLTGLLFRSSAVVVANSDEMVNAAHQAGAQDVRLIGTPIAKQFLSAPVMPLAPQLQTVLYVGRLAPEKNIEAFLQAVERLPHIRFMVAGDGPLRTMVETHAQTYSNLNYLGWLARENVISALDSADMLVLPSTVESFGTVALEAMARRRLVLTSANCGILNWPALAHGIFSIQKQESLTDAIQRVERVEPYVREEKAESAYNAARSFNTDTITQWLAVFRRILA
jgi:glycosyltransferase involved in cell wall biosynthesis